MARSPGCSGESARADPKIKARLADLGGMVLVRLEAIIRVRISPVAGEETVSLGRKPLHVYRKSPPPHRTRCNTRFGPRLGILSRREAPMQVFTALDAFRILGLPPRSDLFSSRSFRTCAANAFYWSPRVA